MSSINRKSNTEPPIIAGMDSRNENFTSWEWLICRIIPKEIVTPLLDMLENTENPCAIPIRNSVKSIDVSSILC